MVGTRSCALRRRRSKDGTMAGRSMVMEGPQLRKRKRAMAEAAKKKRREMQSRTGSASLPAPFGYHAFIAPPVGSIDYSSGRRSQE